MEGIEVSISLFRTAPKTKKKTQAPSRTFPLAIWSVFNMHAVIFWFPYPILSSSSTGTPPSPIGSVLLYLRPDRADDIYVNRIIIKYQMSLAMPRHASYPLFLSFFLIIDSSLSSGCVFSNGRIPLTIFIAFYIPHILLFIAGLILKTWPQLQTIK